MTDSEAMSRLFLSGIKSALCETALQGGGDERLLLVTSRQGAEKILSECGEHITDVGLVLLSDEER